MRMPGLPSLFFLLYLLGILPWLALRSSRRLRAAEDGTGAKPLPSREAIWMGTLFFQGALFLLAWSTGTTFDFHILAVHALGTREVLAAALALGVMFILRAVSRAIRSEEERKRMVVYKLAPRSGREWLFWVATVLAASIAEEAAYRGVGFSILRYSFDGPWPAVLICAAAFAVAHWTQGWKSAAIVFGIALLMHALVAFTGTLVLAMIVHATYDIVAGTLIAREARRLDLEALSPRAAPAA